MDEADADIVAILLDVKVRDETIIAHVTVRGCVIVFSDLTQVFFEVGDGVLEPCHLRGVLGGPGLNGKGKAVDELAELRSRDVGVTVESGEDGVRGQGQDFQDGSTSWRGGHRSRWRGCS